MLTLKDWINSPEYKELVERMQKSQEEQIKTLEDNLTQDMVADIRHWRVGEAPDNLDANNWRDISKLFVEKYPEFSDKYNIVMDDQISGMLLCDVAMSLLKQKPEEGWN